MDYPESTKVIVSEIGTVLTRVDNADVARFIRVITGAPNIFVIGVGRVMLMAQAFAKRLTHLGCSSYVVGETTVPPIGGGDVLIACSGSGETMTTVNIARLARQHGAVVAAVTARRESALVGLATVTVVLPCPTKLHLAGEAASIQPMGSLFEQSLLIFFDSIAMMIKQDRGLTEEQLWKTHANLE